jgi:hypothetical protein
MTDNTKAIQLKLQKAKENAAGRRPANTKVYLGNCVYAEFSPKYVRLTDEDGYGRALDTIGLNSDQIAKFGEAIKVHMQCG